MSRDFTMKKQICYNLVIVDKKYGSWFLKKLQEYEQTKNRRVTITEFAKYVGVSQPTLSSWISETRKPSAEAALNLANIFNDFEIMDLLDYPNPRKFPEDVVDSSLPPSLKLSFDAAVDEIERTYKARGITDLSSPLALQIAKEIFQQHGWTVTT